MAGEKITVHLTTGIGTLSFPRVFESTKGKHKTKGTDIYDVQFLIPKSDKETARAILLAIKKVGEAKAGDRWKQLKNPLRDGDKEKDQLTDDGTTTKGEKYPERLGCWFINARSTKPVAVVDRHRVPITDPGAIYAGVKAKIAVEFYGYSTEGNHGVGCGLNGVQKIADGEAIGGGGKPAVESMFDMLDDDEDLGLDEGEDLLDDEPEAEPAPPPAKRAAAKKAASSTAAKKAAAKKAAAPPPAEEDDLVDLDEADEDDDLYADLDDEDA